MSCIGLRVDHMAIELVVQVMTDS